MHRSAVALFAAVVLAGCSAPGEPSPTAPASAAATGAPTSREPTAAPSPTTKPCPTETPMSVDAYLAADPSCFGAADVTIAGWEDLPTYTSQKQAPPNSPTWLTAFVPAILEPTIPHRDCDEDSGPCSWIDVHIDPASKLAFETDGAWVVVTGHRDDKAAASCKLAGPMPDGSDQTPAPDAVVDLCRASFVLTSVQVESPPAGSLGFCPSGPVLTVAQYQAADAVCFHGRTVKILGWRDLLPAVDFDGPLIDPSWLEYPSGVIWGTKPIEADGNAHCAVDPCPWIFVMANPAVGPKIAGPAGWVMVTGHIDDRAADGCHFVPGGFGGGGPLANDVYAREGCRAAFVVTAIEKTPAPSG
jgi:hypothetical protein